MLQSPSDDTVLQSQSDDTALQSPSDNGDDQPANAECPENSSMDIEFYTQLVAFVAEGIIAGKTKDYDQRK